MEHLSDLFKNEFVNVRYVRMRPGIVVYGSGLSSFVPLA